MLIQRLFAFLSETPFKYFDGKFFKKCKKNNLDGTEFYFSTLHGGKGDVISIDVFEDESINLEINSGNAIEEFENISVDEMMSLLEKFIPKN